MIPTGPIAIQTKSVTHLVVGHDGHNDSAIRRLRHLKAGDSARIAQLAHGVSGPFIFWRFSCRNCSKKAREVSMKAAQ